MSNTNVPLTNEKYYQKIIWKNDRSMHIFVCGRFLNELVGKNTKFNQTLDYFIW